MPVIYGAEINPWHKLETLVLIATNVTFFPLISAQFAILSVSLFVTCQMCDDAGLYDLMVTHAKTL